MTIRLTPRIVGEISPEQSDDLGLARREHYMLVCDTPAGDWMTLLTADTDYGAFVTQTLNTLTPGNVDLSLDKFPIMLRMTPKQVAEFLEASE